MKILFYDTKKYDRDSFEKILPEYSDLEVEFLEADLSPRTAALAKGYDAICAFVSSDVSEKVVECLALGRTFLFRNMPILHSRDLKC